MVHELPKREMVPLGDIMTMRHNILLEQQKTIQQNHMSGRPLRARPDVAAGFAPLLGRRADLSTRLIS